MTATPTRRAATLPARRQHGSFLKGCLIALAIVIVLGAIAGYVIYSNAKSWAASAAASVAKAAVDDTQIAENQKTAIKDQIDRVRDEFVAGNLTMEQVGNIVEKIMGPIIQVAMIQTVQEQYIEPAQMPEEEKEEARLAIQRFMRGIAEDKIKWAAAEEVTEPITVEQTDPDTGETVTKIKDEPTVDELRAFIANVKAKADEAGIPEEPYEVDLAAQIKQAVDTELQQAQEGDGGDGAHGG